MLGGNLLTSCSKPKHDKGAGGNFIGAFGLGFHSPFIVADQIYLASLPPATAKDPKPAQHVFSSNANEPSFEVYPDPRGNTLERGTDITLLLKQGAIKYLEEENIRNLVSKHSAFSTSFPFISLPNVKMRFQFRRRDANQVLNREDGMAAEKVDEDEAVVEDTTAKEEEKEKPVPTKRVIVDERAQLK